MHPAAAKETLEDIVAELSLSPAKQEHLHQAERLLAELTDVPPGKSTVKRLLAAAEWIQSYRRGERAFDQPSLGALISTHNRTVFFCGAGLSVSAGLPVYRNGSGNAWDETARDEFSAAAWKRDPAKVIARVNEFRAQMARTQPGPQHYYLAKMAKRPGVRIMSTNIDDLLERAGCPVTSSTYLHGSARHYWQGCTRIDGGYGPLPLDGEVKPDVLLHGEEYPAHTLQALQDLQDLGKGDLLVVIGSSCRSVNPFKLVGLGTKTVLIDPDPNTALSADVVHRTRVELALEGLLLGQSQCVPQLTP